MMNQTTETTQLIYGIIKQDGAYYLEAVSGPFDTRAGHAHLLNIEPRPCDRDEAAAVLSLAQAGNVPAEARRENGVFHVAFSRPVQLGDARRLARVRARATREVA